MDEDKEEKEQTNNKKPNFPLLYLNAKAKELLEIGRKTARRLRRLI
jgi:hypothetical protein